MVISIRHNIKSMIDDQYEYINGLINSYPKLSNDWRENQFKKFEIYAKENSDGDKDIEKDIYNQLEDGLYYTYLEESIFNNSMFLIVFSYFEGVVNAISVRENITVYSKKGKEIVRPNFYEIIPQIEKTKGFALSIDAKCNLRCLKILKNLRNYITHNNGALGSEKEKSIIDLINKIESVDIYNGSVVVKDLIFVQNVLDKIYLILNELSKRLEYKTKFI